MVRVLTHVLLAIGYVFVIKQKRIARESLTIAFGDSKSEGEIERTVKQCFYNLGRGLVEMVYFLSHLDLVDEKVTIEGKEYLDQALKEGKGVVAVTAHFGNFPLMMLYCIRQGIKTNAIIRPTRDLEMERFLQTQRTNCGLNTIYAVPRVSCVNQSLKALRNNEILFVPLDQNFGNSAGVFVDFFGQKAATATGPVVFARRTGAPILPMFIVRQEGDRHKIVIEPPVDIEEKEDEEETLRHNITKITGLIEQYVRKYPHEWGWMHRRWKSRPSALNKGVNMVKKNVS